MFNKSRETEKDAAPSPAAYRAMVQTIKVSQAVRQRTLEDVLADPPKLPTLTVPKEQEKAAGAAGAATGAAAAAATSNSD